MAKMIGKTENNLELLSQFKIKYNYWGKAIQQYQYYSKNLK